MTDGWAPTGTIRTGGVRPGGRRRTGGTVALGLVLTAVGVFTPGSAASQDWTDLTRSKRLSGERTLDVRVRYGAGRFDVRAGDRGTLYRVHLRYDADVFSPLLEDREGRLEVGVEGREGRSQTRRGDSGAELSLALPRDVDTALRMEFGAVRADMDLGGIPLTSLRLSTGASESTIRVSEPNRAALDRVQMEVGAARFEARDLGNLNAARFDVEAAVGDVVLDFGGEWRRDGHISVKVGMGSLALHFPGDVGLRVEKSGFLAPFTAPALERRGDVWFSPGYEGATRKVTVELEAALGSIDVTWDGREG